MECVSQGTPLSTAELELVGRLWGSLPLSRRSLYPAAVSKMDLPHFKVGRLHAAAVGTVTSSRACAA